LGLRGTFVVGGSWLGHISLHISADRGWGIFILQNLFISHSISRRIVVVAWRLGNIGWHIAWRLGGGIVGTSLGGLEVA